MLEVTDICLVIVFFSICMLILCCLSHKKDVIELTKTNEKMIDEISSYRQSLDEACGYMVELPKDLTGIRRSQKAWLNKFAFGDKVYHTDRLYLNAEDGEWYIQGHYEASEMFFDGTTTSAEQELIAKASEVICRC